MAPVQYPGYKAKINKKQYINWVGKMLIKKLKW
jgi:hypothetical protein